MANLLIGLAFKPAQMKRNGQAGWVNNWASHLDAEVMPHFTVEDIMSHDMVFIHNDINNKSIGGFNLPGGMPPESKGGQQLLQRYDAVHQAYMMGKQFTQLDIPQRHYSAMLKPTKWRDTDHIQASWEWMDNIDCIDQLSITKGYEVWGDSHSTSVAPPSWVVGRTDGAFLHGMLYPNREAGRISLVERIRPGTKAVLIKAGDIDIRHSVGYFGGFAAVDKLVEELSRQVKDMEQRGIDMYVSHVMPQSPDSRVPKTGHYKPKGAKGPKLTHKGENHERQSWGYYFNKRMDQLFKPTQIVKYLGYTDENGNLDEDKMESGTSFHIAPEHFNNRWYKG